jgi:hypothetical protein
VYLFEDGLEQRGLVREVVVQRPGRDPRVTGDLLDRRRCEPALAEQAAPEAIRAARVCCACSARSDGRSGGSVTSPV